MSLKVKVVNALLTRDVGSLSQMDPYVKLQLGSQKFCTSVDKGAGKKPKWNQFFNFISFNLEKNYNLQLYIMDEGSVTDTLIAGLDINTKQIVQNIQRNGVEQIFTVIYSGKSVGKIMIKIQSTIGASKASNIQNPISLVEKTQEKNQECSGMLNKQEPSKGKQSLIEQNKQSNPMNLWQTALQGNMQLNQQLGNNVDPNLQNQQENYHYNHQPYYQQQQGYVHQPVQPVMYAPQQFGGYPPQQQMYYGNNQPQGGYGYQQVGYPQNQVVYQQPPVYSSQMQPNYNQNPLNSSINSWSNPSSKK